MANLNELKKMIYRHAEDVVGNYEGMLEELEDYVIKRKAVCVNYEGVWYRAICDIELSNSVEHSDGDYYTPEFDDVVTTCNPSILNIVRTDTKEVIYGKPMTRKAEKFFECGKRYA